MNARLVLIRALRRAALLIRTRWTPLLALAGLVVMPALAAAQTTTQVVEYYTTDAIGSVRAVTKQVNGQWQVVARHDFMPFGEEVAPPIPPQDKRLFTGKERDSETGQDYFEARYLSAGLGRFTTVDPVQVSPAHFLDPQRWNSYAYVMNRPLRFTDPDGRLADEDQKNPSAQDNGASKKPVLPEDPSKLGPEWKDITPVPDNPKSPRRYVNPDGVQIEFDPANPDKAPDTHGGRDGWHEIDPKTGKRIKTGPTGHLEPGDPVPAPHTPTAGKHEGPDTTKRVMTAVGAGVIGYATYRVLRMLPSLVPALWWTVPANVIVP